MAGGRAMLAAVVAAALVLGAAAMSGGPDRLAERVSARHLDDLMLLPRGESAGWQPDGDDALRYPWPEQFAGHVPPPGMQPFDPWTFAKNGAAILDLAEAGFPEARIAALSASLAEAARAHTRSAGGCAYITNDFDYPYLWSHFRAGFAGAFMNAVTAYGYLLLHEASGAAVYLADAHSLLAAAAGCPSGAIRLSAPDADGHLWLNEYVFRPPAEDRALFRFLGFQEDAGPDAPFRARIYNGHIHALYAYLRYARATGSTEFDGLIAAAVDTMRARLPDQLRPEGFFAYEAELPDYPDYGAYRAVALAAGLCEITGDAAICAAAARMRTAYEATIRDHGRPAFDAAYERTRAMVRAWRESSS